MHRIEIELTNRILILDGAMGTMIQTYGLQEQDFRSNDFQQLPLELKGNNELLNITRPDVIMQIHGLYLEAGADILSTNTFNGNSLSQADYQTDHLVEEINYQGARLARMAVEQYSKDFASRPLFVAGAIGPTNKLASLSSNIANPAARAVTFDQLVEVFTRQAKALIQGGIDLFLLETVTDTLNAKAALYALMHEFDQIGKKYPIMVSATITDASGRILSGQTLEAFLISISHAPLLSVGLNCALGAGELRPYVEELAKISPFYVSTHPNAGLPNEFGDYDQTPKQLAALLEEFAQEGWLNLVGGCCGTTPLHIQALKKAVEKYAPRVGSVGQASTSRVISGGVKHRNRKPLWQLVGKTTKPKESGVPLYSLKEMMSVISQIEEEGDYYQVRKHLQEEKKMYHAEQFMLLQAHLFGRFQYLQLESKLIKIK